MDGQVDAEGRAAPALRVFAAGSLREPFEALAAEWRRGSELPVAVSYANARDLARRIEDGEPADVFASASPEHPAALHARGLIEEPRPFAGNRLVVAVSHASRAADASILAARGTRVVVEVEGIPLGDYTRVLLARLEASLGAGFAAAVLANVVSQEQTVFAVVERLDAGEADAAVLYSTDVVAAADRLRAIEVPVAVLGTYVMGVIRGAGQPLAARDWCALVRGRFGREALAAAGFNAPG